MIRVGLLSDTHGRLDPAALEHLRGCQEIWHAGDLGSLEVARRLEEVAVLRAVHGNIDGPEVRARFPEDLRFDCQGLRVWMTHIGGRPGRYPRRVAEGLREDPPDLFVCGHSHLLQVARDRRHGCLYLNPGACGDEGVHPVKTLLRLELERGEVKRAQVVALGPRGSSAGRAKPPGP